MSVPQTLQKSACHGTVTRTSRRSSHCEQYISLPILHPCVHPDPSTLSESKTLLNGHGNIRESGRYLSYRGSRTGGSEERSAVYPDMRSSFGTGTRIGTPHITHLVLRVISVRARCGVRRHLCVDFNELQNRTYRREPRSHRDHCLSPIPITCVIDGRGMQAQDIGCISLLPYWTSESVHWHEEHVERR